VLTVPVSCATTNVKNVYKTHLQTLTVSPHPIFDTGLPTTTYNHLSTAMKVTNSFTSIFTAVAILGSFVVQAAPAVEVTARDVYIPHITSPLAGDVWTSHTTAQVTWDTSDAPKQITNRIGWVMLRDSNRATPGRHLSLHQLP
jgi:hypothetical protein